MDERPSRTLKALGGAVLLSTALILAIAGLDRAFPPSTGARLDYSVEVVDRQGGALRVYTSKDGYWRFPASTADIDSQFLAMLIACEDRRFYRHPGFDAFALGRALVQAGVNGRFVSGGSTLTMQVVRLLEPRPRTLWSKAIEIFRAWQLERRLGKEGVLRLYLELAPYGGNLQGLRSASRFYFGKEPRYLTLAESALLVALPQSPENRRPDRFRERARAARDRVLGRLVESGVIDREEARAAADKDVPGKRRAVPRLAPHLSDRLRHARSGAERIWTTLDGGLQRRLESLLVRHQRSLPSGATLAALIVDNADAEVRAYVGSGHYFSTEFPGQVDVVRATRSPGSTLKPFVYGLGFEAGFIHPETLITDRPGSVRGYAPGNFDRRYEGEMKIRDALSSSRNTTAIRVLDRVGPTELLSRLRATGADLRLPSTVEQPGLPIVLGGVGASLEDLVMLYAALADRGTARPLRFRQDVEAPETKIGLLSPVSAWYLTEILAKAPAPSGFLSGTGGAAFKTGTSYGFRDAWALGFDADHTVGVWLGRPDGGYTPGLSGLRNAAPVLLEVFDLLGGRGVGPLLKDPPEGVLIATNTVLPEALRYFADPDSGRPATDAIAPGVRIGFPPDGSLFELASGRDSELLIEARGGTRPYHWLVDGRYWPSAGSSRRFSWLLDREGRFEVTVIDGAGRSDRVRFSIVEPGS